MKVPILFLTFNRPDTTKRVFESIRRIKPKKLYVACDGPRENNKDDLEKIKNVKAVTEQIDWDCEVCRLYREKNLGCRKAVSSAITWFFKNEEIGIILEDDCLPNPTFFKYCEILLNKYKNEPQIMHIAGSNFNLVDPSFENSILFSKISFIWGWASWRRAWDYYNFEMDSWPEFKQKTNLLSKIFFDEKTLKFRRKLFDKVYNKQIDTWDYQWLYSLIENDGYAIVPKNNLISNIGFSKDATHTTSRNNRFDYEVTSMEFPLKLPDKITRNLDLDRLYFRKTNPESVLTRVLNKLKKIYCFFIMVGCKFANL